MKVAVAGKGGIGKTTVSAALALCLAEQGHTPLAVDADPDATLGYALGWPHELVASIRPLAEMGELLTRRATGGVESTGIFSLSPPVADLIEEHTLCRDGIRLMVMGTITEGGAGCLCSHNATLKAILRELVAQEGDLIADMVAGLEHLGRGTAAAMQGLLAVTDATGPALRSVQRIVELAGDLHLEPVVVVANRVRGPEQLEAIRRAVAPVPVAGAISYHDLLPAEGVFAGAAGEAFHEEACRLVAQLQEILER